MTETNASASEANFLALQQDPFFEPAADLIADYLTDAFDKPASGEVDRWTLSALPSTNRTAERERLFTLNVGPMEVLFVERFLEDGEIVDYRVALYVSASALTATTSRTIDELRNTLPLLRFEPSGLASADGDGVLIDWFVSDEGADDQFFTLPLAAAIRPLADHLVTKGRGPYAQYHNRPFASEVLTRVGGAYA
ncbi:hypothetical protein [Nocardia camponoti]|uniref:Uncharacterized protein n=1 Tax=Nocardia camponoti TaxID=1616106 RepID=A0A917QAW6_9NOCA|nr:hypothetical protein [Nocardia camponoti]GGK40503.1 hypothetical protein GCM10011591_10150 [Nocardia camponoti]